MPTYEYACEKCGGSFEYFQSMKDDALTTCPKEKCQRKTWGKGRVKRAIGAGAGLIFKGSGFYITDYRSEGYKESAKKDSESTKPKETAPAKADAGTTKKETKPAAKPGGKSKKE